MAFGLCAGGFLFPRASVNVMAPCAVSAVQSLGKPAGPPAQEGQLEGAHFKGQAAGVTSGDLEFHSWLRPHEFRVDSYLSSFPQTRLEMDYNQKHKYKWII